jgi:uncharacterized membrane protein YphA (DoxX/SURF4 family)
LFYRVDYAVGIIVGGFLLGYFFSKISSTISAERVGRSFYWVAAILTLARTLLLVGVMFAPHVSWLLLLGNLFGDSLGVAFGVVCGLAARRCDGRTLLSDPPVFNGLCVIVAFNFGLSGIGKAFAFKPMTEFFALSGYPVGFLQFIMVAEVFGAIGLLWSLTTGVAALGLAVDMFGAVLTHVHNGDSLNDSTGAIVMLLRLGVVGLSWSLQRHAKRDMRALRRSCVVVGVSAAFCLLAALAGSAFVRHFGTSIDAALRPIMNRS